MFVVLCICFRQSRIINHHQEEEEEGVNTKMNSDTQELKGLKVPLSIPGLNILGTEEPLTCNSNPQESAVENRQYSRASTGQKPMRLELESTVNLTDRETPSISVQEVCYIHLIIPIIDHFFLQSIHNMEL